MKFLPAITATAIVGASLITTAPADAFWGDGKAAEQRKLILGAWSCVLKRGGKVIDRSLSLTFKRDSIYWGHYKDRNIDSSTTAVWKINKESELIFKGGTQENEDLRTGEITESTYSDAAYMTILKLTNWRLVFEVEGGGVVTYCSK